MQQEDYKLTTTGVSVRLQEKDDFGAMEDFKQAMHLNPDLPQAYNTEGFSCLFHS